MSKITGQKLQEFVLSFDSDIVAPLEKAGFEHNKYNVFNILNINRQELRHSDFLAFLFNPNQSGDVGRQFLRNFLAMLSKEHPELKLDFFKIFYNNFDKVVVKREYKHIDIIIDIVISGEKFIVVIENKVDSGEQLYDDKEVKGQLAAYKNIVDTEYKTHIPIFLFLSPDKRPPSESDWTPIDYNLIYSVLCKVNTATADSTIITLINDYKKMIRSQFEMENDEKLRAAALKIYNADRDIFEFIFANLPNRVNTTAEIIRDYLDITKWVEFDKIKGARQNTYIIFTTKELKAFDLNINFQIDVKNMIVYFYIVGSYEHRAKLGITDKANSKNIVPPYFLLGNSRSENDVVISKHEQFLFDNNQDALKAEIADMLQMTFAPDGFIVTQSNHICELLLGV